MDKRLVLGFDGGCSTCLELAKKVHEQVGDKLEVQNLRDPQLGKWRKEALGENAPWAPTLFEVDGQKVRAWTGWRLGLVLSRHLGPKDTWKVMQTLGDMSAPTAAEAKRSVVARTVAGGMSRGQFLKGVGGAAVAMTVLSGVGKLARPAEAITVTEITGDDMVSLARARAKTADMVNVGGREWSDGMQTGHVLRNCIEGKCDTVINYDGTCSMSTVNGVTQLSGGCALLKAAKHTFESGNTRTMVTYRLSGGQVMHSRRYATSRNGIKTNAGRWRRIDGTGKFRQITSSHNGRLDKPVPTTRTQDGTLSAQSSDPCGGCPTNDGVSGYYFLEQYVEKIDYLCALDVCGACSYLRFPPAIIGCALAFCIGVTYTYCANYGESCFHCEGGGFA